MKKMVTLSTLLLLLTVALLTTACGGASPQAGEAQAAAPQTEVEKPATSVEVATVETGNIARIFNYSGDLAAQNEVKVIPAAGGRIESLLVKVGDEVKAGDAIATIEQQTYLTQIKQAEAAVQIANLNLAKMKLGSRPEEIAAIQAAVQTARAALNDVATIDDSERTSAAAGLARAQAELRRAQSEYDKIAWAGEVGSTPQALALEQATIGYENSLADYNLDTNPSDSQLAPLQAQLAQAQLQLALTIQPFREVDFETARATIQQAEAALDAAKIQLDETIIKAPFAGIVAELYIDKGNTVGPQGAVVLVISKEMEVTMDVEESRIGEVVKGQSAALEVTAYPSQVFPAVVTSVAPIADKSTHTFEVTITPLDKEGLLRSGMYADVSLMIEERADTLLAPRTAITKIDGQDMAYVVKEDNTVEQQPVTTGLIDGERIEILSGLEAGDTIVTAGLSELEDGAEVKVTEL